MEKKFIFLLAIILSTITTFSQDVFKKLSYTTAIKEANKTNKLVFLVYLFNDCKACNDSITHRLLDDKVALKIKKWFIPIKITPDSKDRLLVQQSLNIMAPAGFYFIDGSANAIFASNYGAYISFDSIIDEGIRRKKSLDFLRMSEKKYFESDVKNATDLKRMITAKTALEQDTRLLLNEYLNLLPEDSLNSINVLQFVARQSPPVESNADSMLRNNPNFSKAWYDMTIDERIKINYKTFKKSTKRAISLRDRDYLDRVIRFARTTYDDDNGKTYIERTILMDYYWNIGDTSKYLSVADEFNNTYALSVNSQAENDSSLSKEKYKNLPIRFLNIKQPKAVYSETDWYANYLFNAANFFYYVDKNGKYLDDSIEWITTALKLNPNYVFSHLCALLLYKAGRKEEAIQYETEAIKGSRLANEVFAKNWPQILDKMKKSQSIDLMN